MSDTLGRLRRLISKRLGIEEVAVTPNASFVDDLGADSLGDTLGPTQE